ncbi:SDR family NAD(P)-dependent oxidoreductase [Neobacillus notoginsengisoli]|uniref:SDR family NAD(P)-dependent oxidoreductase n=1 Tax=Neobacillus notoginsengisoli TaxID=1578198 RepID=A0A417YJV0_9BACI|nr:SDR family NAD(P)-dependent oxidoreductase [Neobacillus notoginsengisoli]RHW33349.1 SDR family NAD(P)-dependent oxidoreductase [Neobacillus notoginsengisoli]
METFVITGAGSGLGQEMALLLAKKGWDILLTGRTLDKLAAVKKEIEAAGGSADTLVLDVSDSAALPEKLGQALAGKTVAGLINNAGVGYFGPLMEMNNPEIEEMFQINTLGTIYMTKAILPFLQKRQAGQVVNIISTAGLRGKVNESVYAATKFAVRGFTESLQKEYEGNGITFTAAYMGGMNTPFWENSSLVSDPSRLRSAREIAEIIVNRLGEKEIIIESQKS